MNKQPVERYFQTLAEGNKECYSKGENQWGLQAYSRRELPLESERKHVMKNNSIMLLYPVVVEGKEYHYGRGDNQWGWKAYSRGDFAVGEGKEVC